MRALYGSNLEIELVGKVDATTTVCEPIVAVGIQKHIAELRMLGLWKEQKKFLQPEAYLKLFTNSTSLIGQDVF